jgi:Zn-dependent protease
VDPTFRLVVFQVVTTVIPLVLCIAVHEWAHVAMARFLGDDTGERQDRLTLNPLAHADPIWTILVPTYFVVVQSLAGNAFAAPFFGAGRPAPYNPMKLDRRFFGKRVTMRTGELLVAVAGPASNAVLAAIAVALLYASVRAGQSFDDPRSLSMLLFRFVLMNSGLAIFNMIPIPPLDGSKVLASLLPREAARAYEAFAQRAGWLLFVVVIFGAGYVLSPVQGAVARLVFRIVS